jgi:hypothetical protein
MLPLRWAVLLLVLTPGSMPAHAQCAPAALERFLYLGGIEELVAGAPRNARTWALLVARRDGLDAARTAALQEAVVRWPDAAALRASLLQALKRRLRTCTPGRRARHAGAWRVGRAAGCAREGGRRPARGARCGSVRGRGE